MLRFTRIDAASREWSEALSSYQDRTAFQNPAWLAFLADTQDGEPVVAALKQGQQTVGYFVGLVIKKFGLRILGSPFPGWTTSYMGLCLDEHITRRQAIEALVPFAFEELQCVHLEMMDRRLTIDEVAALGFDFHTYKGFEVDLTLTEEVLFGNMDSACRRCIRKAEKERVLIEEAADMAFADDFWEQLTDVFAKQSLVPTYGIERVRKLIQHIHPTGMLLLLRARDSNGRCIATGIFPAWNGAMYFWGGASWRQFQPLRPNEAIQWYAMRYWKQRRMRIYDMGGSGEYKRKYGGTEINVPWFRTSKYRWIPIVRNACKAMVTYHQKLRGSAEQFASRR